VRPTSMAVGKYLAVDSAGEVFGRDSRQGVNAALWDETRRSATQWRGGVGRRWRGAADDLRRRWRSKMTGRQAP
jgi:hypothetical protein